MPHLRLRQLYKKSKFNFNYIIKLKTNRNNDNISLILELLKNSSTGKWKVKYKNNLKKGAAELYLYDKTDLILVKLCYSEFLYKIYEIKRLIVF